MMTWGPLWADDTVFSKGPEGVTAKLGGVYPYEIRPGAFERYSESPSRFRVALTNRILTLASTDKACLFNRANIDEALRQVVPSYTHRLGTLISELARRVDRSVQQTAPLSLRPDDLLTNTLCRLTSTPDAQELRAMIIYGRKKGYLATGDTVVNDRYTVAITPEGLIYLEDSETVPASSREAFVAMWFSEETNAAYADGIAPAIQELGYEPVRIDKHEHANKIDDEIIFGIRRSRFVVADFSCGADGARGGVYFEAGYALALGRPVIWTVRSSDLPRVHFDIRQFNQIVWNDPQELRTALARRIGAVVGPYGA